MVDRARGETGKRAGFRILSRKGWGFNSLRAQRIGLFHRGCSSVVEHLVANEDVVGSSPITRFTFRERCYGRFSGRDLKADRRYASPITRSILEDRRAMFLCEEGA